ncbi:MAG: archease [Actinomycetota bacterium]
MATRGHELIEHTADVGLRVWAPTLGELFAEAAVALVDVMGATAAPPERTEEVRMDAPDLDALFVDWLSEVLFLFDARGFVTCAADVRVSSDPWLLDATLEGAGARSFVAHGPAVKAVTYHGLEVESTAVGYQARVYLDV